MPAPRLSPVSVGARVRLASSGDLATVLVSNECRLRVRLDKRAEATITTREGEVITVRRVIEKDISPDTELEVLSCNT